MASPSVPRLDVTELLAGRAAISRPVILVFEDVQRSEPASLPLLLLPETETATPVLVLGSYRDDPPSAAQLTDLLAAVELDTDGSTPPDRDGGARRSPRLTPRELEVLQLVAEGWSNKRIATRLVISPRTVGVHVSHLLRKLGVRTRGEASALAHRRGLLATASATPPAIPAQGPPGDGSREGQR